MQHTAQPLYILYSRGLYYICYILSRTYLVLRFGGHTFRSKFRPWNNYADAYEFKASAAARQRERAFTYLKIAQFSPNRISTSTSWNHSAPDLFRSNFPHDRARFPVNYSDPPWLLALPRIWLALRFPITHCQYQVSVHSIDCNNRINRILFCRIWTSKINCLFIIN